MMTSTMLQRESERCHPSQPPDPMALNDTRQSIANVQPKTHPHLKLFRDRPLSYQHCMHDAVSVSTHMHHAVTHYSPMHSQSVTHRPSMSIHHTAC
jgi:hypothetical protein